MSSFNIIKFNSKFIFVKKSDLPPLLGWASLWAMAVLCVSRISDGKYRIISYGYQIPTDITYIIFVFISEKKSEFENFWIYPTETIRIRKNVRSDENYPNHFQP